VGPSDASVVKSITHNQVWKNISGTTSTIDPVSEKGTHIPRFTNRQTDPHSAQSHRNLSQEIQT
jgi:hypothetical protein